MDRVTTGYGQGKEVLCRDMETVSRQGTNPPLSREGLTLGAAECVATVHNERATERSVRTLYTRQTCDCAL